MFDKQAFFLDRDGTLIKAIYRPDFLKKITAPFWYKELEFVPRVNEALDFLRKDGFMRIMITNQPDVAHGYMKQVEWNKIHRKVISTLQLDDFYMCRHITADNCPCKKPSPIMITVAACKWGIDLSKSFMVGDTRQDMETGKAAGCQTVLIRAPYNEDARDMADFQIATLFELVTLVKLLHTA